MTRNRKPRVERLESRRVLAAAIHSGQTNPEGWLVQLAPSDDEVASLGFLQQQLEQPGEISGSVIRPLPGNRWALVEVDEVDRALAQQKLSSLPGVIRVEPNQWVLASQLDPPSDPSFIDQYPLVEGGISGSDLGVLDAWQVAQDTSGSIGSRSIVTAVVDSGIDYSHPDLYLNIWINQGEIPPAIRPVPGDNTRLQDIDGDGLITFVDLNHSDNSQFVTELSGEDEDGNDYIDAGDLFADSLWINNVDDDGAFDDELCPTFPTQACGFVDDLFGWDFLEGDNDPFDQDGGHGTHVSGTIGAVGNGTGRSVGESEVGITGINWTASILPVRFLGGNNRGTLPGAIDALSYLNLLAKHERADIRVINNSWGFRDLSTALLEQMDASEDLGLLQVAAAGNGDLLNNGLNLDQSPIYPAAFPNSNVISVAASNEFDELARFSNFSAEQVDIAAPGDRILSTEPDGGYGLRSGTSMAAPHVAGAATLLWSTFPDAQNFEIRGALIESAQQTVFEEVVASQGRLDIGAAFAADRFAPIASLELAPDVDQQSTADTYLFQVEFRDETALNAATIQSGDNLVVESAGGLDDPIVAQFVRFVDDQTNPMRRVAEYQITPPGGHWDAFDPNEFSIRILADNTITDSSNNLARSAMADGLLGSFQVTREIEPVGEEFHVNILTDSIDVNPGDGVCEDAAGFCSLRAAVMEANELPGTQTIHLGTGVHELSILDETQFRSLRDEAGDLNIEESLILLGSGASTTTIDAKGIDRIFEFNNFSGPDSEHLTLSDLTLKNGATISTLKGGAINVNAVNLFLLRTVFESNSAWGAGAISARDNTPDLASSINAGIRVPADSTGTGFILNTGSLFPDLIPPDDGHDEMFAVRYRADTWEYSNGEQWLAFQPEENDRLLATLDFNNNTVTPLQGTLDVIHGIDSGFIYGDIEFIANRYNGVTEQGQFDAIGDVYSVKPLARFIIQDSVFRDNQATDSRGGGMEVNGYEITINSSEFIGNRALDDSGGALSATRSKLDVRDSLFNMNRAAEFGEGGALDLFAVSARITNSQFDSNITEGSRDGGAISHSGRALRIFDTSFTENFSGGTGGAVYTLPNELELDQIEFTSNQSLGGLGGGGGLYAFGFGYGTIDLKNLTVDSNTADSFGGGLYLSGLGGTIENSLFRNNSGEAGGGLFVSNDEHQELMLTRITVIDNASERSGAGIYFLSIGDGFEVTLLDSQISGNRKTAVSGTGAGVSSSTSPLRVGNTTITGNSGGEDLAILTGSGGTFESLGGNVIGAGDDGRSIGIPANSIAGVIFNDLNDNGIRDTGEPTLSDVQLYLDLTENGVAETNEPTAISSFDGTFVFPSLQPGRSYVVAPLTVPNFTQTKPDPEDKSLPEELRGTIRVTIGDGDVVSGLEFGFRRDVNGLSQNGNITGFVFDDLNQNGVKDDGEPGIPNVRVFIDEGENPNGVWDAGERFELTSTGTQALGVGEYRFDEVDPGSVRLVVEPIASKQASGPLSNTLSENLGGNPFDFGDPQFITSGLFNEDDELDFVLSDGNSQKNRVILLESDSGQPNGYLQKVLPGIYNSPGAITTGKLNNDDIPDIVVSNEGSDQLTILLSQGDGSFQAQSLTVGFQQNFVSTFNVDTDPNDLDEIFVSQKKGISASRVERVSYYPNLGDGQFGEAVVLPDLPTTNPAHLLHADVAGDTTPELIVTGFENDRVVAIYEFVGHNYQLLNNFELPSAVNPIFSVAARLNDDALLDLAVADAGADKIYVLLNDPDNKGQFCGSEQCSIAELQFIGGVSDPTALVATDADGDNDIDLVATIHEAGGNDLTVIRNFGDGTFDSTPSTFGTAPFIRERSLTRNFVAIDGNAGPAALFGVPQNGSFSIVANSVNAGTFNFSLPAGRTIRQRNFGLVSANQPPALGNIGDRSVDEGAQLIFTATATDPDTPANTLTFSLDAGAPTGASINPTTGQFSWMPDEAKGGASFEVTIRVTDDGDPQLDDFETIQIIVNEVNQRPTLASIGNRTLDEGEELTFIALANDPDTPANTLTFSLDAGAPAGISINPTTGEFSWTPNETQGPNTYDVTIRVTDNGTPNLNDFETIQIVVGEVNQPPTLVGIGNRTIDEGATLSFTAIANDPDTPANTLTFSLDAGAPTGASIDATTGEFRWTPNETQGPNTYDVTVRVTDNGTPNLSDFETIQIVVGEVNQPPTLGSIGNRTIDEGEELKFIASANDPDTPANTLTFSLDTGAPTGASINPTTGEFSWTPTETQGPNTFDVTVRVTDNGTPNLSDFETIQIVVGEVNQPPTLVGIGNRTIDEGATLSFTATANDPDVPANMLTFSLDAGAPTGASINPNTGQFSWTPSEQQGSKTFEVTIRVTDNGTPQLDDFETIQIVVDGVNESPSLNQIGDQSINEGSQLTFTATATDPDTPANTLTFSLDPGAPSGAQIDPITGQFRWTPSELEGPEVYDVTVRVTDDGVPSLSDFETIQIVVGEVNQPPTLGNIGIQTIDEGEELTFIALANDPDVPVNTLTFSLDVGAPTGASINPTTGQFSWTPTETQGPGTFDVSVRVTDSGTPNLSDFETIQIVVGEVNLPPMLGNIGNRSVDEGVELTFTATAIDPDTPANALSFSLDPGAPVGASIDPDTGQFRWTPSSSQGGSHEITLRVTDDGTPQRSDFERIEILVNQSLDFGDAPTRLQSGFANDYPVTRSQDGARHRESALLLGSHIDAESDGIPDSLALGDDQQGDADEDGVRVLTSVVTTSETTSASFEILASEAGRLDAWIDWNQNGSWSDPGEQVFRSIQLTGGLNLLPYTVPANALPGNTFARFRVSTTGNLTPLGAALDGEVEDHLVSVLDGSVQNDFFLTLASESTLLTQIGRQVVARVDGNEIFAVPNSIVTELMIFGDTNDNVIEIDSNLISNINLKLDGSVGNNTIQVTGGSATLDFTTDGSLFAQRFQTLDLTDSSNQELRLNSNSVQQLSPDGQFVVQGGAEDQIVLENDSDWRMGPTAIRNGQFFRSITNSNEVGIAFQVDFPNAWQNLVRTSDVNNNGEVTANDVIIIINELSRGQFSDPASGVLNAPESVEIWPDIYYDQNGDDRVSALDALRVINQLARFVIGAPEGEQSIDLPDSSDASFRHQQDSEPEHRWGQPPPSIANLSYFSAGCPDLTRSDQPTNVHRIPALADDELVDRLLVDDEFLSNLDNEFTPTLTR